jgi:hypothetical protein
LNEVWLKLQGPVEPLQGLFLPIGPSRQDVAQTIARIGITWIECAGPLDVLQRFLKPIQIAKRACARAQRQDMVRP